MAQYTLTNLIPTAMDGSSWSGGSLSTTHTLYSSKSLQLTSTTSNREVLATYQYSSIPQIQNHIYYGRIYEYHESSSLDPQTWQIYWPIAEPFFNQTKFGSANQWNMLSAINVRNSWASANQSLRVDFDNNYVAGTVWYDGLMLIDLTATFGSGNEPHKTWCDNNIPYFISTKTINAELPRKFNLHTSAVTGKLRTGDIINCDYTGTEKSVTLPRGTYQLEVWGASGGNYSSGVGGKGGYSTGILKLKSDTLVYLYVGGQGSGSTSGAGWNGGGNGGSSHTTGGGGGTDIRLKSNSLYARVIVAGGGGGIESCWGNGYNGGFGGGTSGGRGYSSVSNGYGTGGGPTGGGYNVYSSNAYGSFGQAGNGSSISTCASGGGGGWYGGGGAFGGNAGGGSGYVYTSSTTSQYPSGCLLNSNYYLTDASTIGGNTSFISPSGAAETGHTGNGYARITVVSADITITYDANGGKTPPPPMFVSPGEAFILDGMDGMPGKNPTTTNLTTYFYNDDQLITSLQTSSTIKYTFSHWNSQPNGKGTKYYANEPARFDNDITLYAQYTSTMEPAVLTFPSCDDYTIETQKTIKLINEDKYYSELGTSCLLTRYFKEWNTKKDGSGNSFSSGDELNISSNMVFYAQFFNVENYISINLPVLSEYNKEFLGWYSPRDKGTHNGLYTPIDNTSLYARWKNLSGDSRYDLHIYNTLDKQYLDYEGYIYMQGKWVSINNYIYPWSGKTATTWNTLNPYNWNYISNEVWSKL